MSTSKTLESKEQAKVIKFCKEMGIYCRKYQASIYGTSGTSDLLICLKGKFVAIEMKRKGKKAGALQDWNREQVQKSGGICEVFDDGDDAVAWLKGIMDVDLVRMDEQDQDRAEFMSR